MGERRLITSLDSSSKIIFTLLHDSRFGDKFLGTVNIRMERLFEFQRLQPNEGEYHLTVYLDATIDILTI